MGQRRVIPSHRYTNEYEQFVAATSKLEVALRHIIENAAEHNDADSPVVTVRLQVANEGGHVEIVVADNGPGIPPQERDVLIEGEETPLRHGSGLGLWIVNWIVNRQVVGSDSTLPIPVEVRSGSHYRPLKRASPGDWYGRHRAIKTSAPAVNNSVM
jgi:light-regulated signal transduction histidine kinase (bacteriophytochrome)